MTNATLDYRVGDIPAAWPGVRTVSPIRAPFKSNLPTTLRNLYREVVRYLGGKNVRVLLDLPNGALDLREDGKLRAGARPGRAVVLSFTDRNGNPHLYPCDRFGWWEDNLHAIAVVLEDLRRAERYGVQSSLIRAGFLALPASTAGATELTPEAAAAEIGRHSPYLTSTILQDPAAARRAIQVARGATHPDKHGGDRNLYDLVEAAADALTKVHGSSPHYSGAL